MLKKIKVYGTLKKFLGQSVSLDSLCRKYNIDLTGRDIHGALKDAKLLAAVYLELIGGRQSKLEFEENNDIPIYLKDKIVGRTTSGCFSFNYNKNLVFGYINSGLSSEKINKQAFEI